MSEGELRELPVNEPKTGDGSLIELDPQAEPNGEDFAVQAAESSAGAAIPDPGLLEARDQLLQVLGGQELMTQAVVSAAEGGSGLGLENIQGVGVGIRSAARRYTGEIVVKVFVVEKAPLHRLNGSGRVPPTVNGYSTDVEEVGEINAFVYSGHYPRPVPCGVSCGEIDITAGTIGCLVVLDNRKLCILSNNHVLADVNSAPVNSPILQPGPIDGGHNPADLIGRLERFEPVKFPGPNLVDCAAALTASSIVKPQHVTYELNPAPLAASLNLSVMKNGRTTQATMGTITAMHVNNVSVNYGNGRVAVFNDQLFVQGIGSRPFSAGGDSGSLIVSSNTRQPVALLFAGSPTHTIANPILSVMRALRIARFVNRLPGS